MKYLVTGGAGFLGKFVESELISGGVSKKDIFIPRSADHDLRNAEVCKKLVKNIDVVIHLAARVGGIGYNQAHPASLFYDNATMGINLIHSAHLARVKKVVIVGTVCAYPKFTTVPFKESDLWNGYPEETNAPYGLAKKMLLVQAQAYRAEYGLNAIYLLPVNLYGPGDNFDPASSHVIPALIKKFVEAVRQNKSEVTIWGTGRASREFLFVKDASRAIVLASRKYNSPEPINIGSGQEITILKLATLIGKMTGFKGKIIFDSTKPDGQPRRSLDVSKATKLFGFTAETSFPAGLKKTIAWYKEHRSRV